MIGRLAALLRAVPLALLLPLPVVVGLAAAALSPDRAVLWLASSALGVIVVSLVLTHQVRPGGEGATVWTRELNRLSDRLRAAERRRSLAEQGSERRTGAVSPDTSKTFRLFTQLVRAEEATRAHIAADLHDAVAQTLSRALVELRADQQSAALGSLVDAEEQLRAVMARIRPPELADGDLARAVADLAGDLDSRYGVEVAVIWPEESLPLPSVLATTLYRFVQEALTNAVVHADGVDVRLAVVVCGHELHVTVSDGGPGFVPDAVASPDGRHVGLALARERARLAGGVVDVESAPGRGTRVRLRLPLAAGVPLGLGRPEQPHPS